MSEQATPASAIEPWLREILRCPACRSELQKLQHLQCAAAQA